MFLNFSDFEPRIIPNLFLNTKGLISPKNVRNMAPIFVDVLLQHKTKQEFIFVSITQKYI